VIIRAWVNLRGPQTRVPAIQIKPLAVELFGIKLPDFTPYTKKDGYWFRRQLSGITDILVCTASFKHGAIQIDLYCGLFDDWAGSYGTHLGWSGLRLDNLRYNSGAVNVELIGYRHQQTRESIVSALEEAVRDIDRYALPFFEGFRHRITNHVLIRAGLEWIRERRSLIPVTVGRDIQSELSRVKIYKMENPYFLELRSYLHDVASRENSSRQDRRDISILVMDLFQRFTDTNGNI